MADILSPEKRSWNMSRIRGANTKPEMLVRSMLHRAGFRFRIHDKSLPGKPDIVLKKYKSVIFVNGCFWHRHEGCAEATTPKTRREFWEVKFKRTVERDKEQKDALEKLGWQVICIWECDLKRSADLTISQIVNGLKGGRYGN